jgi:MFS superfamily sulfate permease-like transporter
VSAIAVGAGLLVPFVGLARLGWLADFLSLPIVAGFMTGMGVVIIAHQLPHATGVTGVEGSFLHTALGTC